MATLKSKASNRNNAKVIAMADAMAACCNVDTKVFLKLAVKYVRWGLTPDAVCSVLHCVTVIENATDAPLPVDNPRLLKQISAARAERDYAVKFDAGFLHAAGIAAWDGIAPIA